MSLVEKYIHDEKLTDFAKIYLYLIEKEVFPEIDSSFKTIDYLSFNYKFINSKKNSSKDELFNNYKYSYTNNFKDNFENHLSKIYGLVLRQYELDTQKYYYLNGDDTFGKGKRR